MVVSWIFLVPGSAWEPQIKKLFDRLLSKSISAA
jgi:hypothetical protein